MTVKTLYGALKTPDDAEIHAGILGSKPRDRALRGSIERIIKLGYTEEEAAAMVGGYARILKFNPYHDERGRFSSKNKDAFKGGKAAAYAASKNTGKSADQIIDETLSKDDAAEVRGILKRLSGGGGPPPVQSTEDRYTEMRNGRRVYTVERRKEHKKILGQLAADMDKYKGKPPPKMIVLGGLGGSGKSSFEKSGRGSVNVYDKKKFMVLDADAIKERMSYLGYNGANAAEYHEESSYLLKQAIKLARAKHVNTVLDITMASPKDGMIHAFKKAGYKTEANYMFVSPEVAARRALLRWAGGGPGERGRLVPPDVILSMTSNPKNFDRTSKLVDSYAFYDNMGSAPKRVF